INVRFFFSSRRRHTRSKRDWSSDVCSSDLYLTTEEKTSECRRALEEMNREMSDLAGARDKYDSENKELNNRLVELSKRLENTSGRIELYKERKNNKGQLVEELKVRLFEQNSRVGSLDAKKAEADSTAESLNEHAARLKKSLRETKEQQRYLTEDQGDEIEKLKD